MKSKCQSKPTYSFPKKSQCELQIERYIPKVVYFILPREPHRGTGASESSRRKQRLPYAQGMEPITSRLAPQVGQLA
jgi:hypothetical protein